MNTLNELLHYLGWIFKSYEFLIVLWFMFFKFTIHKWQLFFESHHSLEQYELHSCFLTALVFNIFHILGGEVEMYLVAFDFEQVNRIKVFYTGMIAYKFVLLVMLFTLHRLKHCLFSKTARICMYMTFIYMSLLFMELIARGYFDFHELTPLYRIGGWLSNIIAIAALSIYPIRQTLKYFAERREQALE